MPQIDSKMIVRAIRAAGLDPNNPQHLASFTAALRAELQQRQGAGSQADALAGAANRVKFAKQADHIQTHNLHNNPTELFKLTDISSGRVTPGLLGKPEQTGLGPSYGDNFTVDPRQKHSGLGPSPKDTFTQDGKATPPDLNELWNEARRQGKI